jgi:hypothetical protein
MKITQVTTIYVVVIHSNYAWRRLQVMKITQVTTIYVVEFKGTQALSVQLTVHVRYRTRYDTY